jgi:hypothetical protein
MNPENGLRESKKTPNWRTVWSPHWKNEIGQLGDEEKILVNPPENIMNMMERDRTEHSQASWGLFNGPLLFSEFRLRSSLPCFAVDTSSESS